jgi:hypothetical protein
MKTTPREQSQGEIGWLAGIVDGEGSILLTRLDGRYHNRYMYGLYLVNTNREMLYKAVRIMCALTGDEIVGHRPLIKMKHYKNQLGRKQCYQVTIRRQEWLLKILQAILPHLTEKRKRAERLLAFLSGHTKYKWHRKEGLDKLIDS